MGAGLLAVIVSCFLIVSCSACYEQCIAQFNSALAAAHQSGNTTAGLEMSCQALLRHIDCLRKIDSSLCDSTMAQMVQSTIVSTQSSYDRSCKPGAEVVNCGAQYILCNEQFNATFGPAMTSYDLATVCKSMNNYTNCVEQLINTPDCAQYANHAINAVNNIKSRHDSLCPGTTNDIMARCMNETMECYISFNNSFYPSMQKSNMTLMCSSVVNYSNCVQKIASEPSCEPYTVQAVNSIRVLQQQHQTACGEDGGKMATECLIKFKECYQHFNETFNPAVQKMDIHKLCESMDEYKQCAVTIPSDCVRYLGQSIDGLNRMQSQYSQYCTPENKKIFACSQLSQCNRNLIGNLTMSGAESGMLCLVLESYFPCVDRAVSECMLSGDGVTAVSFSDLGLISSRYCRSVLTNPSIKSCMSFMQCHAAFDLNSISPSMMVEGTYWCHYMESSLMCSSRLISAGQCAVQNRQNMLDNIGHLHQLTRNTCSAPPSTTEGSIASTTESKMEEIVTVDTKHKDTHDHGQHVHDDYKDNVVPGSMGDTDKQGKSTGAIPRIRKTSIGITVFTMALFNLLLF